MGEGEYNFDGELEQLLKGTYDDVRAVERKPLEPIYESVDKERNALVESFYSHYIAISNLDALETVDDFIAVSDALREQASAMQALGDFDDLDEDGYEEDIPFIVPDGIGENGEEYDVFDVSIIPSLNTLMQKDVEQYAVMASGEMRVSGEGLYKFMPDEGFDGRSSDSLRDGQTLSGDINQYIALPSVAYDDFRRGVVHDDGELHEGAQALIETPSPWLYLTNVVIRDNNGIEFARYDDVMVPLDYPSLQFHKISYGPAEEENSARTEKAAMRITLADHLKGSYIIEIYNDMENDLNYNKYETEKAHYKQRAEYHEVLSRYAESIDQMCPIRLDAFEVQFADGGVAGLDNQIGNYNGPAILEYDGKWRVVHSFVITGEDDGFRIAHVLPEYITAIEYLDEQ